MKGWDSLSTIFEEKHCLKSQKNRHEYIFYDIMFCE